MTLQNYINVNYLASQQVTKKTKTSFATFLENYLYLQFILTKKIFYGL